jgi:hypothetical protein
LIGPGRSGSPAPVDSWQPGAFAMQPFAPSERHEPRRHRDTERHLRSTDAQSSDRNLEIADTSLCASVSLWPDMPMPAVALRRFRIPVPARVRMEAGKPARVLTDRCGLAGGSVETCAGPWRTSGGWWTDGQLVGSGQWAVGGGPRTPQLSWDRDEWDVMLSDGATYRVFREREVNAWFIEGIID